MFEAEQSQLEGKIRVFCAQNGLPEFIPQWTWVPFSGQWGISTSFFQLAAAEARQGEKINVQHRAAELAQQIADLLGSGRLCPGGSKRKPTLTSFSYPANIPGG